VHIRPATAADIETILGVERAAPEASHWSRAQYAAALDVSNRCRVTLLIEDNSQVQGFVMAREVDSEWEIENIAVDLAIRQRGLGLSLLKTLIELAIERHAKIVRLEVRESNSAARALYEKCGFIHSGVRLHYYREPVESAVQYRLIFL
jgi:[ribosomal protein S18]-alanine N-acetyltransferase